MPTHFPTALLQAVLLTAGCLVMTPVWAHAQLQPIVLDETALAEAGIVRGSTFVQGRPSVVIVHGDNPDPAHFADLANNLARDFNVFVFVYQKQMISPQFGDPFRSQLETFIDGHATVEDASNQFDDAMRVLMAQTREMTMNILTHSMGGLVAKDATTSDRATANTLARGGANAPKYNLILVASPLHGTESLNITGIPVLDPLVTSLAGAFSNIFSPYYAPMSDPDNPFLSGRPGSNVNLCQVITTADDVVTLEGQEYPNPSDGPPSENMHWRDAGHVDILTDPKNSRFLANLVREKAGQPRKDLEVSKSTGHGIGGSYRQDHGSIPASFAEDTTMFIVDNEVQETQTRTSSAADLNRDYDHDWDLNVFSVDGSVRLTRQDAKLQAAAEASVGIADATLVFRPMAATGTTTTYANDGGYFAIGGRADWYANGPETPGVFAGGAYRFERTGDLDVMRQPALTAQGATVTEVDTLAYRAHVIEGLVGYATEMVSASGGVRQVARRVELTGDIRGDFSEAAGFPAFQDITFVNEFDDTAVQATGRVDIRIPDTSLVVHVNASAGGDRTSFRIGLTVRR